MPNLLRGAAQRLDGDVQHRDVADASLEEVTGERESPAADVDDRPLGGEAAGLEDAETGSGGCLGPAVGRAGLPGAVSVIGS